MGSYAEEYLSTVAPASTQKNQSSHNGPVHKIEDALLEARRRYVAANPVSQSLHQEAVKYMPGGNTRTVLYSSPFPLSMVSGEGSFLVDEDQHKYTDLLGEYSAGLYGHSQPTIQAAIRSTLNDTGLNLGANTRYEMEYASLLCSRFGLQSVRFCNSGTEANLHALMAARAFTKKKRVVAFTGGYHGGVLSFREKPAENTINDAEFLVVEYNNIAAATSVIEGVPDLAAVIVEAMQGASGNILGSDAFLHAVEESARKVGAVFILDEVLTSRLAPGGLQSKLGLRPDITTLGKYLGGGLAFGVLGGRRDIMSVFDPRNATALPHSGTFNNNTLAMRAGLAGLSNVYTPAQAIAFNDNGEALLRRLQEVCKGTQCVWTGRGSLLAVHFLETGNTDIRSISDLKENEPLKESFWLQMIEDGFWIARRGSVSIILGTPQAELDRFFRAVVRFLELNADLVKIAASK